MKARTLSNTVAFVYIAVYFGYSQKGGFCRYLRTPPKSTTDSDSYVGETCLYHSKLEAAKACAIPFFPKSSIVSRGRNPA